MKIQAIHTNAPGRKYLFHERQPVFVRALLSLLLVSAAFAPLRAATLNTGFGPLVLVEGETPVPGGCGRPQAACTCCGHDMGMEMAMDMNMGMDLGGPVVDSTVRLDGGPNFDASPTSLSVTNVGTTAYSINSVNNPILTFVRGETYTFTINANGHPFYIKTVQGAGTGNAFTNGVTGNGTQVGTVTFTVPLDAPDTLFYDCANHTPMTNRIDVVPEPSALAAITVLGLVVMVARRRARA
jgi:hypothetical protein